MTSAALSPTLYRQPRTRDRRWSALAALVAFVGCAVAAGAQVHAIRRSRVVVPAPENPKPLTVSAATEAKLARLATIDQLPAEDWRMHAGDLAHGEAPELDDAGWTTVKGPYLGTTGAMWFRRTIVVPPTLDGYDLTGAAIHFAFDIWAEGPVPIIVYFNGRRVAMGEAMEPISLFENAKPGDKIVVAVKALDSADAKHFRKANLDIEFAKSRPDPRTFYLEAVSAEYLLPALLQDAGDTAKLAEDRKTLEDAVGLVEVNALARADQAAFDRSLRASQAKLEVLRPLLSQAGFNLTGNAHIDAAWVWPWTETVDVVRRTFGTALQLMREYPAYTYSQSQAAYYEWMAEKYPATRDDMKARIKEGRWEAVGGMWVEPDLNLLDGESIVRQLLVGTRYLKREYGATVHVGWNPDTFGYTWQLPQIYKKSGIDYFVTQKMAWNETNRLPLKLFYWQSPDGSRVLTYFPHDYNNLVLPDHLAADFNVARRDNPGLPEMLHLYGVGDHGGGPTRTMLDYADTWMEKDKIFGSMHYGVAETYLARMKTKLDDAHAPVWNYASLAAGGGTLPEPPEGKISVPVWNDELYLEYTRGVFTTQAQQKRNMRESEEWLLDAEKWSAMDWLKGAKYPGTELNEAWKKVLFNQFHDIAGGSGVDMLYKDAQRDYDVVYLVARTAREQALHDLSGYVDTSAKGRIAEGGVPVVVWNSLGWPRTDAVTAEIQLPGNGTAIEVVDGHGKTVPSQASMTPSGKPSLKASRTVTFLAKDVPAVGYSVFYARPAHAAAIAPAAVAVVSGPATTVLENEFLRVTVDMRNGCMTHLVDKRTKYDSIANGGCGNQLQAFHDDPQDYDAWNIDPGTLDHPIPIDRVDAVTVERKGPQSASVRVARSWQHSKFVQEIVVSAGLDRVDVLNEIDWHERHILLKAAFPLAASAPMAAYEIPYGSIDRPTTRANSWDAAKFEVPALRWADLSDAQHGLSLLNESKYGYDAEGNVLRLSLLRSSTAPDPHADQGAHRFRYAVYPHAGGWKQAETMRRGYEFNYKLEASQVAAHAGSLPSTFSLVGVEDRNLVLTALKKTEDGDGLLLRFFEWEGRSGTATITVPEGATSSTMTNLMEVPEGGALTVAPHTVRVPYTAYGITTIRVNYGHTAHDAPEIATQP